jgi:hypothetical protein
MKIIKVITKLDHDATYVVVEYGFGEAERMFNNHWPEVKIKRMELVSTDVISFWGKN